MRTSLTLPPECWSSKNSGSSTCKRGFVQFCYEPIKKIIATCMNDQKDKLWPMLQKLGQPYEEYSAGETTAFLTRHISPVVV